MKPALIAALVGLTAPAALLAQTTTSPPDSATGAMPSDHMTTDSAPAAPSASDAAQAGVSSDSPSEAATAADMNAGGQPMNGGTATASDTDTAESDTTEAPTAVTGADAANGDGPTGSHQQDVGASPADTAAHATTTGDTAAPTSDISADADGDVQELVDQIASGGMFEIRSSEIALERSSDPDVRDFAQTMITDHGSIMTELEVLAEARNLTVPTQISGPAADHLQAVEAAEAGDIDAVYLDHQAQSHAEMLELLEPWTIEPDDTGVGAFAQKTYQAVTTHAERLNTLRD